MESQTIVGSDIIIVPKFDNNSISVEFWADELQLNR